LRHNSSLHKGCIILKNNLDNSKITYYNIFTYFLNFCSMKTKNKKVAVQRQKNTARFDLVKIARQSKTERFLRLCESI